jgi:hypothetical protein
MEWKMTLSAVKQLRPNQLLGKGLGEKALEEFDSPAATM